jgi:hypothetical protein
MALKAVFIVKEPGSWYHIFAMWILAVFLLFCGFPGPGFLKAGNAQGPVTVEGVWVVIKQETPNPANSNLGEKVTIRRISEGVYEALWTSPRRGAQLDPAPQIYFGGPAGISRVETPSFAMLKESSPGIPDRVLQGAINWGLQRTCYYQPAKDGGTMHFLQDGLVIVYDPKSGNFLSLKKEPPFSTAVLKRVSEPGAAPARTSGPPSPDKR